MMDDEELSDAVKDLQATTNFIQSQQIEILRALKLLCRQMEETSRVLLLLVPQMRASISVSNDLVGGSKLTNTESGVGGFSFRSESFGIGSYRSETVVVGPILIESRSSFSTQSFAAGDSIASSTGVEHDNAAEDESTMLEVEATESAETTSPDLKELLQKLFSRPIARSKPSLIRSHVVCSEKFSQTEKVCFSTIEREALGWPLEEICGVVYPSPGPRKDHFLARDRPSSWPPPPQIWRSDEESEKLSLIVELQKLILRRKIARAERIRFAVDATEFGVMMRTMIRLVEELLVCDKPPPWPPPTSSDLAHQRATTMDWSRGGRNRRLTFGDALSNSNGGCGVFGMALF